MHDSPPVRRSIRRFLFWFRTQLFGADVFISYSRRDAAFYATELANRLEKEVKGLSCFIDQRAYRAEGRLPRELLSELFGARLMVVIAGEHALTSAAVRREVSLFLRLRRPVVPIAIVPHDQSVSWQHPPWVDVKGAMCELEPEQSVVNAQPSQRVHDRVVSAITFATRGRRQRRAAVLTTIFVVAGAVATLWFGRQAALQARIARSTGLAAESINEIEARPSRAIRQAVDAYAAAPDRLPAVARRALFLAVTRYPGLLRIFAPGEARERISDVAFSPDRTTVVTTTFSGNVIFRDVRSGAIVVRHSGVTDLLSIDFSPSGRRLITTALNNRLLVWDVATHAKLADLTVPDLVMPTPRFLSDDRFLVVGARVGGDTSIIEWQLPDVSRSAANTTIPLETLSGCQPGGITWPGFAFDRDARRIAVINSGRIVVFDRISRAVLFCAGAEGEVVKVAISPDASRLAWGDRDGRVVLADLAGNRRSSMNFREEIVDMAVDPSGRRVALTGGSSVWLFDGSTSIRRTYRPESVAMSVVFADPAGERVYVGYGDATVAEWSTAAELTLPFDRKIAIGEPRRAAFTSDGRFLLTADGDAFRNAIVVDSGSVVPLSAVRAAGSRHLEVVRDPRNTNAMLLRDAVTNNTVSSVAINAPVTAIGASADGSTLAGIANGTLIVWDVDSGKVRSRSAADRRSEHVEVSAGGTWIATATDDGLVALHGPEERPVFGFVDDQRIGRLIISGDGDLVAASTSSLGGEIVIWDTRTGLRIATFDHSAYALAFSPDAQQLLAAINKELIVHSLSARAWHDRAAAIAR